MFPKITVAEYRLIMNALVHQYGMGYSDNLEVSRLQAKLSIMAEAQAAIECEREYLKGGD